MDNTKNIVEKCMELIEEISEDKDSYDKSCEIYDPGIKEQVPKFTAAVEPQALSHTVERKFKEGIGVMNRHKDEESAIELHYVGQSITERIKEFDPGKLCSIVKVEYIVQKFKEGIGVSEDTVYNKVC